MYTESRKMVLKNLLTGQQWRNRQRTDLWPWARGGEGEMCGKVTRKLTLPCVKQRAVGICPMAWETQTGFDLEVCINREG